MRAGALTSSFNDIIFTQANKWGWTDIFKKHYYFGLLTVT